ncbi:MAG: YdcF family protein [Xanthomonadales bacterium]|nr:YdcF family protein [Xanthomonadales bacterium]MCB1641803.1 YdcF family protein [Xanthomonadales bacterium]
MPANEHAPYLTRDIAHSMGVALLACMASGGLLYLYYLLRASWIAVRSQQLNESEGCVLVFGKRLRAGAPDGEFEARLQHALRLAHAKPDRPLMLLGGAAPGEPSEAAVGAARLRELGLPQGIDVQLEDQSRDTLQNLRHARTLLGVGRPRVLLLSSRYHLARCAQFAGQLGFDYELCAAEPRVRFSLVLLRRLAGEAVYLCWLDIGTRWARLIGHRRMLAWVT